MSKKGINAKTATFVAALMLAAGSSTATMTEKTATPTTDNEIEMLKQRLDAQEEMLRNLIGRSMPRHHPRAFFDDFYFFPDDILFALPTPDANNAFGLMNVSDKKDMIEVSVELPGMEKDDISIEVKNNVLTIAGEKKDEKEVKKGDYYMQEHQFGTFNRSVALPENVDINKITSHLKNGVLTVVIPKTKAKAAEVRKITVD